MGECRDFKFGGQSQPMDNKPSLKGARSRYVTNFKFWGTQFISGMNEATVVRFCTHEGRIKLVVMG